MLKIYWKSHELFQRSHWKGRSVQGLSSPKPRQLWLWTKSFLLPNFHSELNSGAGDSWDHRVCWGIIPMVTFCRLVWKAPTTACQLTSILVYGASWGGRGRLDALASDVPRSSDLSRDTSETTPLLPAQMASVTRSLIRWLQTQGCGSTPAVLDQDFYGPPGHIC